MPGIMPLSQIRLAQAQALSTGVAGSAPAGNRMYQTEEKKTMRKRLVKSLSRCPVTAPQAQSLAGSFGIETGSYKLGGLQKRRQGHDPRMQVSDGGSRCESTEIIMFVTKPMPLENGGMRTQERSGLRKFDAIPDRLPEL